VELGAPAAFARIVWHWDDFLPLSPRCARSLSIVGAGTEPIASAGRSAKVTAASSTEPTEDLSLQRECLTNQRPRVDPSRCSLPFSPVQLRVQLSLRVNSHCHIETSSRREDSR